MTPQPTKRGRPKLSDARMNLKWLLNSADRYVRKDRFDYLEELGHLKARNGYGNRRDFAAADYVVSFAEKCGMTNRRPRFGYGVVASDERTTRPSFRSP